MNGAPDQSVAVWIAQRSPAWQDLETRIPDLEDRQRTDPELALQAVRSYPELARDLAIARRQSPGSALARQLEQLYARLHRGLFRPPANIRQDLTALFVREAPAIARELRQRIFVIALGFFLAAAAGWWLVATFPELARLFASEAMIASVQSGRLWTDGMLNVLPSSVLSVGIFTNNIVVSLMAFCLGAIYGLGTIYLVGLNGLLIGAAFALTAQHGLAGRLFEFIVAHGFAELSVIFVASAIGFSIGEAIARPGHRTRIQAFQRAASRGAKLMLPCLLFLVGAGLIEGYISPNPIFPLPVRLAVGLSYWLLLLWALGVFKVASKPLAAAD